MKSSKMQSLISGKPLLVINKNGIDKELLKKLNMQTSDLMQAIRSAGYFFGGGNSVRAYGNQRTAFRHPQKNLEEQQQRLPIPLIFDGKWSEDDLKQHGVDRSKAEALLQKHKIKLKT